MSFKRIRRRYKPSYGGWRWLKWFRRKTKAKP